MQRPHAYGAMTRDNHMMLPSLSSCKLHVATLLSHDLIAELLK